MKIENAQLFMGNGQELEMDTNWQICYSILCIILECMPTYYKINCKLSALREKKQKFGLLQWKLP